MIDHPLVNSFRAAFEDDGKHIRRENVSGLSDPHFWKQKTTNWRGAATDSISAVGTGEVWLCAGGLRAKGDNRDFYNQFCSRVKSNGASRFLPTAADRRYQEVEEKHARQTAWKSQIQLSALICLHEVIVSGKTNTLHIPAPQPRDVEDPLLHVTFQIEQVDDGDEVLTELTVHIHFSNPASPNLAERAKQAILNTIQPDYYAWNLLPGPGTDELWAVDVNSQILGIAMRATESGQLPASSTGYWAPASRAHYTGKDYIVEARVEGEAIKSLCGSWFVPTADPDKLPICPVCNERFQSLP